MREINQRRMRCFNEVLVQRSIRKAADALKMDASVLTRQIRLLEEEIGETLFERQARGMEPTEAALHLLEYWRGCEAAQEQLKERLQSGRGPQSGTVRIVVNPGYVESLMTQVLIDFFRHYPQLHIEVDSLSVDEILMELLENRAHIGIAFNPPAHADIEWRASAKQPVGALVRHDHPLARHKGAITVKELLEHPLGVMPMDFGPGQMLHTLAREEHVEPLQAMLTNSLVVLQHLVRGGGVATLADAHRLIPRVGDDATVFVPLRHPLARSARAAVLVKARRPLGLAADELLHRLLTRMSPFAEAPAPKTKSVRRTA